MAAICGKVEVLERLWDWAKKTTAKSRGDKEWCVFVKRQVWKNGLAHGSIMGKS